MKTTVRHIAIRPPQRRVSLGFDTVWEFRELLYFFAWRDLKVRYKQSVVGVGWAILQPLALMILFTIFFGRFAKVPTSGPRPIFYYSALLLWTYFSQAVSQATSSLVQNAPVVTKVYFPRLLLPLSAVLSSLVDFAIAFVLLVGLMAYYIARHAPSVHFGLTALYVPVTVVLVVATATGTSLWLSALYAKYHDVRYALAFLLQFWMFASPVLYPTSLIPQKFRLVYALNPMASAIEGLRWALTGRGQGPGGPLAVSAATVVILLVVSVRYFRRFEGSIADVV